MAVELTLAQWISLAGGALISWLLLNWISTPSPKKFTVKVPEGNETDDQHGEY